MNYSRIKTALTIAGSDSSGGAGIQADLKTMLANGVYGMSAITALTAQNTMGVTAISEVTPEFLGQQLDAVFTDIFPDAVKIGMVSSAPLLDVIAERLEYYDAKMEESLGRLPVCIECEEPIQSDNCYEFDEGYICEDCLDQNHKRWTENIAQECDLYGNTRNDYGNSKSKD